MINNNWYTTLNKSKLTPPGYIFYIVWIILYCIMGYTYFMLYNKYNFVPNIFYIQLIINILWVYVFFILHNIQLSLFIMIILICCVIYMYYKFKTYNIKLANLQIPYLLWLIIAFYFNYYIYSNN